MAYDEHLGEKISKGNQFYNVVIRKNIKNFP